MISVITPVYNGEKFIETCIKVVFEQNCPELEHIIVDGGSTDNTVEIIKQYAQNYHHIRWLSEKDRGQSDAMNKGIAMAKGNIMAILNVDDYYEPDTLNRILEIFKTLPLLSLLIGNCNVWDNENNLKLINRPTKLKLRQLLIEHRINPLPVNPSAYFYHTALHQKIGFYKEDEYYVMDLDFIFRAVQVANVKYVNEIWGNYRQIEGTKTIDDERSGQSAIRIQQLMKDYCKQLPWFQRWRVTIVHNYYSTLFKVQYFLKNPQKILPMFRKKLMFLRLS